MLDLCVARKDRNRECAFDWSYSSVQGKFTDAKDMNQTFLFGEIAVSTEDAEGNREIETCALFSDIGWRQVDRDFLEGKEECAVTNCCANALA
jgi:hypothetical protein